MPGIRIVERQLVRIDQAKSIQRVEHNPRPGIRTTTPERSESIEQGATNTLRLETREYLAEEFGESNHQDYRFRIGLR